MNQVENKKIIQELNMVGLWERTMTGDHNAFAQIHKKLYPGLFGYAIKMVKDEKLVDDLLQDLFIKFWQNSARIGAIQNVKAYFYRSTRSIVLNHIKSTTLKTTKLLGLPEPDLEFSKEDIIVANEYHSELCRKLHCAVNGLPKKQRETVYLRFYENMEYLQIAEITGIKYQSVVNHIYRAVQSLKEVAELKHIYAA
jgi:RNA polymerase sigma-70 factor (ECF subfamily)